MPSFIKDFEYDIFISYRQKDNKYDGWVTEFVDNLKRELEATFKEEVTVYFDVNPHDGLLETHDVNASLKEKLKCLVFIPIISQTYCDPKSFAWQYEFAAFNKMAKEDQFGRDIRLASGNVASRILPVKIHELDEEDKSLIENELGRVLRSIDFIYKASGVNRPSRANEDHPQDNLNKTYYRDQINKVANAVKEIITALKKYNQQDGEILKEVIKANHDSLKKLKPKIILGSLLILILIMLGYFFIPKLFKSSKPVEKSIAVLPFKLLSDEPDKQYLADGMMEALLLHLQKFKDLRVLDRTSVEQYRQTQKTTHIIGQELGVEYLLEGSFQKAGDNVRLDVRLINTREQSNKWVNEYNRNWKDLFAVQSEVAQTIAKELHTTITPEVKQLVEKIPTKNLTAYDFYQRGRDEYTKYLTENNRAALQKAENLFHIALKYDSAFAQAYTGLAWVYWAKHYYGEYFSENFMDSILVLANIALSFDDQLADAYCISGKYYAERGSIKQAIEEYDKTIKLNPNDWKSYYGLGQLYSLVDNLKTIENLQKAASLNHSSELPGILRDISLALLGSGFTEQAKKYNFEALKLDDDSIKYYINLETFEYWLGNNENAVGFLKKGYAIDSTSLIILGDLGYNYAVTKQYKESLIYYKKYIEREKTLGEISLNGTHRIGYIYSKNGYKKEAEYYFDKQIEYCNAQIKLGRPYASQLFYTYYDLAAVYAFRGDKNKAYENLKIFSQAQRYPIWVSLMKNDPLFEGISNEPEFQQIVKDVEAKYRAEHERVKKWIEENSML